MTSYFNVEMAFTQSEPDATPDDFEDFLDALLDEFDKIGREVDLTASLVNRTANFLVATDSLSDEALISVISDIRAALHAAGCSTRGWPAARQILSTQAVESPNPTSKTRRARKVRHTAARSERVVVS